MSLLKCHCQQNHAATEEVFLLAIGIDEADVTMVWRAISDVSYSEQLAQNSVPCCGFVSSLQPADCKS